MDGRGIDFNFSWTADTVFILIAILVFKSKTKEKNTDQNALTE
jgi:hypothetical protein